MQEIQKKLGFGAMRLPMLNNEVDTAQVSRMVDAFLENGFNYFDTAHGYIDGKSERALKTCLTSRYPRERYLLADKLSGPFFKSEADIRPLFESQLEACGVEYFDFYLMHAQGAESFAHFKACRAYETAQALLAEGKIRHLGISFHDKAEVLEQILTEYPMLEFVQLQFNYLDYDDPIVQSGACYDVCCKHGKPVIVMEPVRGGLLATLPDNARAPLDALHGGSPASYAIRYAAGFENIRLVLSGMSTEEQMRDNVSYMKDFAPLTETERAAVAEVRDIFRREVLIPCTSCRYCTAGCPKDIPIPDIFSVMNRKKLHPYIDDEKAYRDACAGKGDAAACIRCSRCELECPQHLPIRALLSDAAKKYGKL